MPTNEDSELANGSQPIAAGVPFFGVDMSLDGDYMVEGRRMPDGIFVVDKITHTPPTLAPPDQLRDAANMISRDGGEAEENIWESAPSYFEIETVDGCEVHATVPAWFDEKLHSMRALYFHPANSVEGAVK